MNITVLALDSAFDTGLSAVLDAFTTANELAPMLDAPQPHFHVTLAGLRPAVRSAQGMALPVVPLASAPAPDLLILPAIGRKMPAPLEAALATAEVADAGVALRRLAGQ